MIPYRLLIIIFIFILFGNSIFNHLSKKKDYKMNIKEALEQSNTDTKEIIYKNFNMLLTAYVNEQGILCWKGTNYVINIETILSDHWQPVKEKIRLQGWIGFFRNDAGVLMSKILNSEEEAKKFTNLNLIDTKYIDEEF